MRVLSGIQPSGNPHLGNYFSMMRRMVEYQDSSELFCFIASYHSMTTVDKGETLAENTLNVAADFLALGIDPNRATFWVQSDVPEVMELAWLLSMHITVSQLQLGHSFKDKTDQGFSPSSGLFFYPVLMAADIVLFGAEKVPVGKDQKQHLEMARDIARRFNLQYGDVLKIPEPDILTDVATVPGVDGRKMSKSYNNAIYPFATEKQLKKAVMGIATDSTPVEEPKPYQGTPLFDIYRLFLDEAGTAALIEKFQTPGVGYGHIKQDLLKAILEYFGPYRERRAEIMQRPDEVRDILSAGAKKARAAAAPYLAAAREKTGLVY
ncbi:MAG: tryptophan--tRNA ligase [bacterium]|nr:tryptophan--tRNA ligase [bacterium]